MRSNALYSLIEKTKLLFPLLIKRTDVLRNVFNSLPNVHRKLLPIISLTVVVLFIIPTTDETTNNKINTSERKAITLTLASNQNVANKAGQEQAQTSNSPQPVKIKLLDPEDIDGEWRAHVIRKGDSVYRIFRQYNIPSTILHELIALQAPEQYITQVKPGQVMSFYISTAGKLIQLRVSDIDNGSVRFSLREDNSYIYQ